MRTIKFRGFNKKNGVWLYGFYLQNRGAHFVAPDEFAYGKSWGDYEVDPDSVGQFTGLQDANETYIYEGDILECWYERNVNPGVVVYRNGSFGFAPNNEDFGPFESLEEFLVGSQFGYKIIGNIHDNPELINKPTND